MADSQVPWGVAALFAALVAGVTGISLFALGVTFNDLVWIFLRVLEELSQREVLIKKDMGVAQKE